MLFLKYIIVGSKVNVLVIIFSFDKLFIVMNCICVNNLFQASRFFPKTIVGSAVPVLIDPYYCEVTDLRKYVSSSKSLC